ncbi:30S ribosomal protein S18 [Prochlorococcus marinus str. MIT 1342]|jgi:small subunit ribosomal protein S18|uniref:Small ribosomal subunit protein bS18 n=2 Tax=Prochlorococcus marinus TaxID=1219 RepID=RS18_PROMM|nr:MULTISPECIES: 30S ribosomal protein S18 [Prochlorococcus]A2C9R4.1 RecName: Full=Small ribosomal subunit protein bS18; AltName: Full=30S ribosomal protein S18 [Prochlorococcus marinus str. MIT 9303]Q7TUZ8.1 RecName: Full=Small ribosomal subunit protein bS18; AltName: Full=30S ribosomal protein S18 [Prochlorococcus marinus str. MIT 9313]MCH2566106.1 30S ribosomal protein S18 [Prochlorococcus sp. ALOHA_A2.0_51]MDP6852212.1 30S ribosomal protein S18 [Prochlorococcaceae cyanobacterium ETNP1_MAG_8|tara:strand:- start:279 stop:500 length:222 start_codon:yes stop_codon:yes gene_type:complete
MSSSFFKKRLSPIKPGDPIDYKDVDLLKKFITDRGKILPRRLTGLTSKQQRDLTNAVKRARIIALLPFVNPEG